MRYSSIPSKLIVSLHCPIAEISLAHPSCVGSISREYGFGDYEFVVWYSSVVNLEDGGAVEVCPSSMDEKFVVGIILGVRLVVELKDVEVNKITHLVVYCLVTSIFVVLVFEVRGLRTMAENMVRDH